MFGWMLRRLLRPFGASGIVPIPPRTDFLCNAQKPELLCNATRLADLRSNGKKTIDLLSQVE